MTTLELRNVPAALRTVPARSERLATLPGTRTVKTEALRLKPGKSGTLVLRLSLPADHHYTPEAGSAWQILAAENTPIAVEEKHAKGELAGAAAAITIPVKGIPRPIVGTVKVEALAYFCREKGACLIGAVVFEVPVVVGEGGKEKVELRYTFEDRSAGLTSPLEFREAK